jgi:hypothetical protein
MREIYDVLRDQALKKTRDFKDEDFLIRGLWKVDLAFRPNLDERTFRYAFLVSQTVGQGSCYCDTELVIDDTLIGKDARDVIKERDCYSISVLDSLYASIPKKPFKVHEIRGNSIQKTALRNEILMTEVEAVVKSVKAAKPRILNVGVVGNLIKGLADRGYVIAATDLEDGIIGTSVHGTRIEHGSRTYHHIAESDVAVITGMTLTTDAMGDIIDTCKAHATKIVIFAETGANFGEEYCSLLGVDSVVSELFPFYIFQGVSTIEVYRKDTE